MAIKLENSFWKKKDLNTPNDLLLTMIYGLKISYIT